MIREKQFKGTYVDVGSHHGNHTIYFSKACPAEKVVAVEGSPYNFSFLESNLILNGCSNVVKHNLIASNENEVDMELFFNPVNTGNTSAYDFRNSNEKTNNKSVKSKRVKCKTRNSDYHNGTNNGIQNGNTYGYISRHDSFTLPRTKSKIDRLYKL